MNAEPGARVASFELLLPIGSGGMGKVWRARDTRLGREVALKFLHENAVDSRSALARFHQEARSASALSHPNIVTIYEFGEVGATPYIVMELVEGPRLRDLLRTRRLTIREVIRIATGIADALACAHERGVTHRDLKPENIMLTGDGRPKVLDFGLAKLVRREAAETEATVQMPTANTAAGTVIGTPAYMSPEQASGLEVDHRSDQFAFGAIVYEMLTGRPAFQRPTSVETMAAIIRDDPDPLSHSVQQVPPELERIMGRCLSKDPDERYASSADLLHDLRALDAGTPTPRSTTVTNSFFERMRVRKAGAVATLAAAAMVVLVGVMFTRSRPDGASARKGSFPERMQIAVLPFVDVKGDVSSERLTRGLSQSIASRLSTMTDVQVIGPWSLAEEDAREDPRTLARSLGANVLLRCNVLRSDDRVRVNYAFIDPTTGVHLDSGTVDRADPDLFALEDNVVAAVARTLNRRVTSPQPRHGLESAAAQDRYFEAISLLQQRYDDRSSVDRAIALLKELQRGAPDSALVGAVLARAYLAKHDLTREREWAVRAEAACRDAYDRDPALFDVALTMGQVYTRTGRFDDAIATFRRALQIQKDSADAMLGLAEALDRSGRYAEAERTYRQAIALRPSHWAGYNKLGVSLSAVGKAVDAAAAFRQAAELAPENMRVRYNLGGALMMTGDFEGASRHLERTAAVRPAGGTWSNLGTCYYHLGRYAEAVTAFHKAVEQTPGDYLLWYNLGDGYRWAGKPADAAPAYEKAVRLAGDELAVDPGNAGVHQTLAAIHAKRGDLVSARASLATAERLAPRDPYTAYSAALVAHLSGSRDAAVRNLARAADAGYGRRLILADPEFAALRSDARFTALTRTTTTRGGTP